MSTALAPLASPALVTRELDVRVLWLADVDGPDVDPSVLDAQERRRAERLAEPADRLSFLVGHVLLREVLGERLGCRPEDLVFVRQPCPSCGGPHGRPALRGHGGQLHFSLARSAGLVLIGVAGVAIGVDVEAVPSNGAADAVSALLHADERGEVRAASPAQRSGAFARLWARKEAYLKGVGTGVAADLAADYLGPCPHPDAPAGWKILDVPVAAGYAAAAAIDRRSG